MFITRDYPKLIHGVKMCGSFFTGFDFFSCFYQARMKGQCFIALQAENVSGQVIFKLQVSKIFVTLFHCMTVSPLPSSVWYLQWRVKLCPSVFHGGLSDKADILLVFHVLFLKKELYMLYFLLRCGLRTKFPESQEKWNTKKLCLLCYI